MTYIANYKFLCLYLKAHNSYPTHGTENAFDKIIEAASNLLIAHGCQRQPGESYSNHWVNRGEKFASKLMNKKQPQQQHQKVLPPIEAFEEHKKNPIAQLDNEIEHQQKILQALIDQRERLKKQAELDLENEETYKRQMALYRSDSFTNTPEWKKLRMKVLTERGAICECCGASAATGANIAVDHIKSRLYYPELSLEESNLQVLCKQCNIGKGSLNKKDWRKK